MQHTKYPRLSLGYSTNVHRGETLDQVYRFLRRYTVPIQRKVFGKSSSGLELRFGVRAATELLNREKRREFAAFLDDSGLELFSINAFPLGDFQALRVKQQVYAPDWRKRDRVLWTQRIARSFADLLPPGRQGSLSTLGGTYRAWSDSKSTRERMAANYLKVLTTLEDLAEANGADIVLAAEPEPDTTFEIADDVIRFVEDHLLPLAQQSWRGRYRNRDAVEEAVRRRFTVNVDTCHFSVLFHEPTRALQELKKAGLKIGKIHVTNALSLKNPLTSPRGYDAFRGMNEPRYLHQFCGVDDLGETVWRGQDLDELPRSLRRGVHPSVTELRTHFHVPLYLKRWKTLRTTQQETAAAVAWAVKHRSSKHFVLETYTWPVLASEQRLVNGIAREYRWLLGELDRAGASW